MDEERSGTVSTGGVAESAVVDVGLVEHVGAASGQTGAVEHEERLRGTAGQAV